MILSTPKRLCFAIAIFILPGYALADGTLNEEEIGRLARGEMVQRPLPNSGEDSLIAGASFALVDAPTEKVWGALKQISAWPKIFPNTVSAKVVFRQRDIQIVKMKLGNSLITFDFYLTASFKEGQCELVYGLNRNKPHDIQESRGWVRLLRQPGGKTLVAFFSVVRVPFGGLIGLLGDNILNTLQYRVLSVPGRLKKYVEEREKQRKVVPLDPSTLMD